MRNVFVILLGCLCFGFGAYAQQSKEIAGSVRSAGGEPLANVSVQTNATGTQRQTDEQGRFQIPVGNNDNALIFSLVGYTPQEVPIAGQSTIEVTLEMEEQSLDEVVVVGYGTQRKVNLTGAVDRIEGVEITKQPVFQTSQALQGLSPGLTAIQSSGQPGADAATLRIRGVGSLTASNDPLVLIDGVEGDINGVDPIDIENISVLKDAAAAAIYGSRASNGVILVTTKRSQSGETSIAYNNYLGWQNPTELPKYVGALDFLRAVGTEQSVIDNYAANMGSNPDEYPDTDWLDLLFTESGFQQYHSVQVNGGGEKSRILASLSYMDQGGNIPNFDYKRYNGRLNTDYKFSDKFDIAFDINFRKGVSTSPTATLTEITAQAFRVDPTQVAIHSDGSWGDGWSGSNPVAAAHASGTTGNDYNYFRGLLRATYRPVNGLSITAMYSPEHQSTLGKQFRKSFTTLTDWVSKATRLVPNRNSMTQSYNQIFQHNFNVVATYDRQFGDHGLTALGGYEFIKSTDSRFDASRMDFVLDEYQELDAGSEATRDNSGSATHYGLLSYFGRINYNYRGKYLFEGNIRSDASSRFRKGNRVAVFPSFSVGWRLTEEPFIGTSDFLSDLKLRASWGRLGNQSLNRDFPYASSIVLGESNFIFGDAVFSGATQDYLANGLVRWETTETTNIGVDAAFLNSRLNLSADYYVRKTKDILLELPIPLVSGLQPSTQNAGNVENKGWDVAVGWRDRAGEFSYSISVNVSDVRNTVTNLANAGPIISNNIVTKVGHPIGSIYAYETQGIFQNTADIENAPAQFGSVIPGNLRYKDQLTVDTDGDGIPDAADGIINADDRVILGNPFPRWSYGAALGAGFKNFDFSASFVGVGKRDVLLLDDAVWPAYNAGKVQEWQMREFWSPENTTAKFPILQPTSYGSNDARASSTWVFDASYLRVRNITLGYTFADLLKIKALNDLRVYASVQNPFTFHNLPEGLDPLIPNESVGAIYPVTATYTFGLNVRF